MEEHAGFLPVEIIDACAEPDREPEADAPEPAGGHRLQIVGPYDPEAPARLIRGLSGP